MSEQAIDFEQLTLNEVETIENLTGISIDQVVGDGTPKGKNQFWQIFELAKKTPDEWFHLVLKASDSKLLPESELKAAAAQISQDQFEQ
jgi:hypothetical protein